MNIRLIPRVLEHRILDYLDDKDVIVFLLSSKALMTKLPQRPPSNLLNRLVNTRRAIRVFVATWLQISNDMDMKEVSMLI